MRAGLLAEFETPEAMLRAITELRGRGYRRLDAFTPYPVRGVDEALGLRRSPLPWIVFPFAIAGAAGGYLVQWHNNAYDYPLIVGGRPAHAAPAFVPITFEMMVLATALSGFVAMLLLARLPELWSPVFDVPGFERASIDRFWIGIDARDPALIRPIAERDLTALGARAVAWAGKERR
ncbi:membrane protein [Sorangium cellulosum]|uniref:Membrane protein n=1 Tax=Sorangium cellulosum TaxID=56 RepID=A0A2L0EXY8_SORCE|nr:DUF3341 domain-containing protein [Sorangium cellulosum]AUX44135.1 membrane protein [Sorangium cellulosum]